MGNFAGSDISSSNNIESGPEFGGSDLDLRLGVSLSDDVKIVVVSVCVVAALATGLAVIAMVHCRKRPACCTVRSIRPKTVYSINKSHSCTIFSEARLYSARHSNHGRLPLLPANDQRLVLLARSSKAKKAAPKFYGLGISTLRDPSKHFAAARGGKSPLQPRLCFSLSPRLLRNLWPLPNLGKRRRSRNQARSVEGGGCPTKWPL